MDITGKTIFITGSNRGIGRALVDEALRRGAKRVYASARKELQHPDKRVMFLKLDVTDAGQIKRAVAQVETLDVLINNAGIAAFDDMADTDAIRDQLAVNLLGMVQVTQALLPLLRRSKGAIVNNLSLLSLAPLPVMPGYSLSKAAAASMTQSLRMRLRDQGVTVHAVFIGPTDTDMNRGLDIPKATTETTARGIFEGLVNGEEDIFPDPASQGVAPGWRTGISKVLEQQFATSA